MIYVQLLNEGTVVYRPAPAAFIGANLAKLLIHDEYDPDDEEWEFKPGSVVRVEMKELQGGPVLVAVATQSTLRWYLNSNSGRESLRFNGTRASDAQGWVGEFFIHVQGLFDEDNSDDSEAEVMALSFRQFRIADDSLLDFVAGLETWLESSYTEGFRVNFSGRYYHNFEFSLEPSEPQTGKAKLRVEGISWSLPHFVFETTLDQTCATETLTSLQNTELESPQS